MPSAAFAARFCGVCCKQNFKKYSDVYESIILKQFSSGTDVAVTKPATSPSRLKMKVNRKNAFPSDVF
jgi:hypothetical protein